MQLKFLIILIPLTTIPGIFCLTQVFSEYSGFFFFFYAFNSGVDHRNDAYVPSRITRYTEPYLGNIL